jgi:histidine triad (HIT) family protein
LVDVAAHARRTEVDPEARPTGCPFCDYFVLGSPERRLAFDTLRQAVAFEPLDPCTPGHTIVVPRHHARRLPELPIMARGMLWAHVTTIYEALGVTSGAEGMNLVVQEGEAGGQSVEHLHVHLVPRRPGDGLGYRWTA